MVHYVMRACDMSGLLSEVDLTDQNRIVFPEGEYTLPMTLPLDKSITIQGAGQDKTIIKGAILVNALPIILLPMLK